MVAAGWSRLGGRALVHCGLCGLLYGAGRSRPVSREGRVEGYVRSVRDDARLDRSLLTEGQGGLDVVGDKVLAALADNGGFLALGDKSPADAIKARLGVSKNAFKQAIGRLYQQRRIVIEQDGIRLTAE